MIDNTTIECEVKLFNGRVEGVFEYKDLLFRPVFNVFGQIKKYDSDIKGLRLNYYHYNERLYINNSLHKVFHGNNYSDFTLSELKDTVENISDTLSIDIARGKLKRLEYGCNVVVDKARSTYSSFLSYRGKEYEPMVGKLGRYGLVCKKSQYDIKAYDKSHQVKLLSGLNLPEEIFRWEMRVKNMQCLHKRKHPIPIVTVNDLIQVDKAQYLCNDLLDKYDLTLKGPILNFDGLNLRKITAYARMINPDTKNIVRINHLPTYRVDNYLYRRILKENQQEETLDIRKRLIQKCNDLLNG